MTARPSSVLRLSSLALTLSLVACGAEKTSAETSTDASFDQDIEVVTDTGQDGGDANTERDAPTDPPSPDVEERPDAADDAADGEDGSDTGPACGNGLLEIGEECDDGASNSANLPDRCRTDCTFPVCGDGVIDSDEDCDDAEANSDDEPGACPTNCILPLCGDGELDSTEECDNGVNNSNEEPDACRTNCREASCGDSVVDSGEACEVGSLGGTTCLDFGFRSGDLACTECGFDDFDCSDVAVCGDGLFVEDSEGCDDGNLSDGDGCSSLCETCDEDGFEPNQSFDEMPSIPYGDTVEGLVAQSGNPDFFSVRVGTGCQLEMTVEFSHDNGDIDVIVYDVRREEVWRAESETDDERVCASRTDEACIPITGGSFSSAPYFIEVVVDGPAACVPYTIRTETVCG